MSRVAAAEVALVVRQLGMDAEVTDDPPGIELHALRLRVHERGTPSASGVRALIRQLAGSEPGLLVVDLVGGRERRLLANAGWSWLERTGHLTIPQLGIDRKIDPVLSTELVSPDLWERPRTMAVALTLLRCDGAAPVSRDLSYYAGVSTNGVNLALHDLRRLGLLDAANWPDRPALFAEVAARWRPRWVGLAEVPSRSGLDAEQTAVLRLGRSHVLDPGWASVGGDALAAHGLEDTTGDGRQRLYVPDRVALAWALRFWSSCEPSEAAALLAVPPTPRAVAERCFPDGRPTSGPGPIEEDHDQWAVVDRIVLALHLASQDQPIPAHKLVALLDLSSETIQRFRSCFDPAHPNPPSTLSSTLEAG